MPWPGEKHLFNHGLCSAYGLYGQGSGHDDAPGVAVLDGGWDAGHDQAIHGGRAVHVVVLHECAHVRHGVLHRVEQRAVLGNHVVARRLVLLGADVPIPSSGSWEQTPQSRMIYSADVFIYSLGADS